MRVHLERIFEFPRRERETPCLQFVAERLMVMKIGDVGDMWLSLPLLELEDQCLVVDYLAYSTA